MKQASFSIHTYTSSRLFLGGKIYHLNCAFRTLLQILLHLSYRSHFQYNLMSVIGVYGTEQWRFCALYSVQKTNMCTGNNASVLTVKYFNTAKNVQFLVNSTYKQFLQTAFSRVADPTHLRLDPDPDPSNTHQELIQTSTFFSYQSYFFRNFYVDIFTLQEMEKLT